MLVPLVKVYVGSFSIGSNFMYLALTIIVLFWHWRQIGRKAIKIFLPFLFYFVAMAVLISLQESHNFSYAYSTITLDVMACLLFPFSLFIVLYYEKNAVKVIAWSLIVSGLIYMFYGIFLTTMPGYNPYLMVTLPYFNLEFNEAYAMGYSGLSDAAAHTELAEGRIFGRISSVFTHPMNYTLNVGLLMIFVIYYLRRVKWLLTIILLIGVVAIITSGVRTPFAALLGTALVALLAYRKVKYFFVVITSIAVIFVFLYFYFPELFDYMTSMFGDSEKEMEGSSLDMRIKQFYGCFDVLQQDLWIGKGYGWTAAYMAQNISHPILLSFESLIFVVLCNTGLIGVFVYFVYIAVIVIQITSVKNSHLRVLLLCIFSYYILFSIITGEYGYMKYFMIYYPILWALYYKGEKKRRLRLKKKRLNDGREYKDRLCHQRRLEV